MVRGHRHFIDIGHFGSTTCTLSAKEGPVLVTGPVPEADPTLLQISVNLDGLLSLLARCLPDL